MNIETGKISGIPETMLYTFYMKYLESIRPGGVIHEPRYNEIIRRISFDFSGFSPFPADSPLLFACRSLLFDSEARDFTRHNPSAVFVSFGSGLDFRFERVDNGSIRWFDIDLPEVTDIRKKVYHETDRLRFIPASALDFSWAEYIDPGDDVFFLAEGLFIYFTRDELKDLILFIMNRFPGSMIMFDSYSSYYRSLMKGSSHYPFLHKMQSMWRLDINDFYEIGRFAPGIIPVKEFDQCDMYSKNMPDSLRELMDSDLAATVKEQVMNMIRVYLLKLDPSETRKDGHAPDSEILYETLQGIG